MKKEFRRHVQKYCDISNWSRMHKPRTTTNLTNYTNLRQNGNNIY